MAYYSRRELLWPKSVCMKGEIAEGGTRLITSGPVEIGVIPSKGMYYPYRNVCPHQGAPACEGLKMPQVVEKIGEKGVYLGMDCGATGAYETMPTPVAQG